MNSEFLKDFGTYGRLTPIGITKYSLVLKRRCKLTKRRGFSLVELLVVITIIGILVGLILPAVFGAYRRSEEFKYFSELTQIEQALESFKGRYGFYPPDFWVINHPDPMIRSGINGFLPYLNRISPNHAELSQAIGHPIGVRRIDVWFNEVGQYLTPETAFVFWLSGLALNKQYPLTWVDDNSTANQADDVVKAIPAYNRPAVKGTSELVAIEREVFFDFKQQNRFFNPQTGIESPPDAFVVSYSQSSGRYEPFIYFELASLPNSTAINPRLNLIPRSRLLLDFTLYRGSVQTIYPYGDLVNDPATAIQSLAKRESFQLMCPGVDGLYTFVNPSTNPSGESFNLDLVLTPPYSNSSFDKNERDNISNFAEGRLEKLILGTN